ncbi:MAG: tetratricopeptide repeat protein [Chloroflexi bacterium]|nr:tetratricopeptide repeat protein [Chloroflexota bacterium]
MFQEPFSLKKLEEFIGREAILQDVRGWMQDEKFRVVFFSGGYGIGKTRLLERILDMARREPKYDGAPEEKRWIDLYDFRHHTAEGLANAIFECFEKTDNKHYFDSFITANQTLDEARAVGDSREIREQMQKLLDSCADGVKKMSDEHGVLLLFDTVEQFVYPTGTHFAPAWDWLKSWIGNLRRGLVLFAGRPAAGALFQQFPCSTIPLDFFTPEETRAYISKVGENWTKAGNRELFRLDEKEVPAIHSLSQGRPILLAIFLELRLQGDPQEFKDLSSLQTKAFEERIINYLISEPKLGETLKAAGRTRKGISAELLMKMSGNSLQEAKEALETLKDRVFARTFPGDDRVFLHDEMYDLLGEHVYADEATTSAADQQAAAQAIYDYYKDAIRQKDEELKDVFSSLAQETDVKQPMNVSEEYIPKIRALETTRQQLKTEFLYYRLRHQIAKGNRKAHEDDPILAGLKNYYRFGHEAATGNNDEILIPLQIELINFWLGLGDENFWKPFIEGMLLLHEVWLKVVTDQNYRDEIPNHEKRLDNIKGLSADQKIILHALLETWLGTGLVFAKEHQYDRAEKIFTDAIENIQKLAVNPRIEWFVETVVSLAYRQRAYLHRTRGAFQKAIEDFQTSLRYSRRIDFFHEEATLRNDLGSAQMRMGRFLSALEDMQDGLQLRYKIAIGPRIALSHSSLAQFYIVTGAYEEAREHARNAIQISEISERVGFWRGQAFGYLAYAEATRRFAFTFLDIPRQKKYLQEAQDAIAVAVSHFEGLSESSRIIDSRLEEACVYRDRVRVDEEPSRRKAWFDKSSKELREVAELAKEAGIYYRQVDAMCNRVWLGYFYGDMEYTLWAAGEFEGLKILIPYWLKNGQYVNEEKANADPILWSHIGKYCMARGIIALDTWEKNKEDMALADAARYFMLSLTYSTKFAPDHRGLREGRHRIYQALNHLNQRELKQFCSYVLVAIEKEKISPTPSGLQKFMEDHALWNTNPTDR